MLHLVYCCIPQFYFVRFRLIICPEVEFADSYFFPPSEHIFHFRPFQVGAAILPVHWNSKFQVGFFRAVLSVSSPKSDIPVLPAHWPVRTH